MLGLLSLNKLPLIEFESGVARGSGWQHIGAFVNLGAYYLAWILIGAVLGFEVHLMGKGLWIGLVIGSTV